MSLIARPGGRKKVVLHFTGHRILGDPARSRFPKNREADVARALARIIRRERVVAGFGGLASGSDILFAEALLAARAELHIVLACDEERFITLSVAEAGPGWVERFRGSLDAATSVTFAKGSGARVPDFGAAADLALDMADKAAAARGRKTLQVAVFDGRRGRGDAGTGPDIERGKARGWRQIVLRLRRRGRIHAIRQRAPVKV